MVREERPAVLPQARLESVLIENDRRAAGGGRVVVTGADGFIGRELLERFRRSGRAALGLVRRAPDVPAPDVAVVADLGTADPSRLDELLEGSVAVVHLAGRAHVMKERARDPAREYRHANVEATARLAAAARRCGVRRLLLASTVKVNGETTRPGKPFRPDDPPAPEDEYARSKLDAERVLARVAQGGAMAPIVLRLPLVYGREVRGNFARLVAAVRAGRPLPFGAIRNRRSVLYVGNLLDAIEAVVDAPSPPAGVHFVADADAVATPTLVRAIGAAWQVPVRLTAVPVPLLALGGALVGAYGAVARLAGSLEVDTTSLREATGWSPAWTLADALADVAAGRAPSPRGAGEGRTARSL